MASKGVTSISLSCRLMASKGVASTSLTVTKLPLASPFWRRSTAACVAAWSFEKSSTTVKIMMKRISEQMNQPPMEKLKPGMRPPTLTISKLTHKGPRPRPMSLELNNGQFLELQIDSHLLNLPSNKVWKAKAVPRVSGSVTFLSSMLVFARVRCSKNKTYMRTVLMAVPVILARIPLGNVIAAYPVRLRTGPLMSA